MVPVGPSGWAHAGPTWVGPRRAQVGGPTLGPSWAQVGPSQKCGTQKNPKNKKSQNQNPFCPKCRQYLFKPEKNLPAPFGALPAHFLRGPEQSKKCTHFAMIIFCTMQGLSCKCAEPCVSKEAISRFQIKTPGSLLLNHRRKGSLR